MFLNEASKVFFHLVVLSTLSKAVLQERTVLMWFFILACLFHLVFEISKPFIRSVALTCHVQDSYSPVLAAAQRWRAAFFFKLVGPLPISESL